VKTNLPDVTIGGHTRPPNPKATRADGSIIVSCVGGPLDRGVMRLYPPYDDPVPCGEGFYILSAPLRSRGNDILIYQRKEQP